MENMITLLYEKRGKTVLGELPFGPELKRRSTKTRINRKGGQKLETETRIPIE